MAEVSLIIKIIRISKEGTALRIIEMKGIEEILKIETGHTTEEASDVETIKKYLLGVGETLDLGIEVDPHLGIEHIYLLRRLKQGACTAHP